MRPIALCRMEEQAVEAPSSTSGVGSGMRAVNAFANPVPRQSSFPEPSVPKQRAGTWISPTDSMPNLLCCLSC